MTFINYAAREINCKIVYYGPGLCGKTTNLQYIYDRTNPSAKGKLISLATETDRTLNWRINMTSFDAACAMIAAGLNVGIVPRATTTPYIRSLSLASIALSDA